MLLTESRGRIAHQYSFQESALNISRPIKRAHEVAAKKGEIPDHRRLDHPAGQE
jgi:hypothetical protein